MLKRPLSLTIRLRTSRCEIVRKITVPIRYVFLSGTIASSCLNRTVFYAFVQLCILRCPFFGISCCIDKFHSQGCRPRRRLPQSTPIPALDLRRSSLPCFWQNLRMLIKSQVERSTNAQLEFCVSSSARSGISSTSQRSRRGIIRFDKEAFKLLLDTIRRAALIAGLQVRTKLT
jgi:hypothetical protein